MTVDHARPLPVAARPAPQDLPLPSLPVLEAGAVWLVGAGPGDPGLLSCLALHALRSADAVIYDAWLEPEILSLVPPSAFVQPALPGRERDAAIARCLKLARDGWRVVRLVEGDVLAAPEGVETAAALAAAGMPFRIVPGITGAIAGPAYAGVPLTYRGTNTAAIFLHLDEGDEPAIDPALARAAVAEGVLVATLRPEQLPALTRSLAEAGLSAETPALLLARPTAPRQVARETVLGEAEGALGALALERQLLLVLGKVVGLRRRLLPPAGQRNAPAPQTTAFTFAGLAG